LLLACLLVSPAEARTLRVCADPNNLPFSNRQEQGFENLLAALLARELGANLSYTWWAQRRGFLRNTLKAGLCDVVAGLPAGLPGVRTTAPYYRSSYMFVSPASRPVRSLDDPALRVAKVGVPLGGDGGGASPPAFALSRRGIRAAGFSVLGDYSRPDPPALIIEAVDAGRIDVAIAWGPLAGYFIRRAKTPLIIRPVAPSHEGRVPMAFDIAVAVRQDDAMLAAELNNILGRKRLEIEALLDSFGVPRIPLSDGAEAAP
jgi:mxaJ protein